MRTREELRVGLVGWNGRQNTGDDAMTSVIVHHLARIGDDLLRCFVLADQDTLPDLSPALPSDHTHGFRGYNRVLGVPTAVLRNRIWDAVFDRRFARNLDLLIFGGGSILHSRQGIKRYSDLLNRAKQCNPACQVGAVGVSLGPFAETGDQEMCASMLGQLDFIGVRDGTSWDELQQMELDVPAVRGMDLGLLLPDYRNLAVPPRGSADDRLGIALRGGILSTEEIAVLGARLAALLERRTELAISLFSFCADGQVGDEDATRCLASAIGHSHRVDIHPYSPDPALFYELIGRCRLMIAMRLHSAVLAYTVQTPLLLLSYHPKCLAFAEEIGLPLEFRINGRSMDPDRVIELIEGQLTTIGQGRSQAEFPLQAAKQSARGHLRLLDDVVDGLPAAGSV